MEQAKLKKTARKILQSAAAEQIINKVASYGANG